jgi:uncharacterized protein YbaP (TraB family)
MRRFAASLALLMVAGPCAPAPAQNAPQKAPVSDWSIETVVVTAKKPGPALWHIRKDKSEVWILGTLGPVPEDLKWDSGPFEAVLDGSRALYLPPRGQVGPLEGIWFLLTEGDVLRLPDGQSLEPTLPPALRARFAAARAAARRDADRYAEYKPSVAGFLLESDFLKARALTGREPQRTIEALAARHTVPVRRIATYEALDVIKEVPSLSPQANLACLKDSLDDIDVMGAHAKPAADAWATGDLDGIKAHYSDPKALDCLGRSASFARLWARSVNDSVSVIDGALKVPGKTVAVINIGELLRKNGILDRLTAQGLTVEGPGE